MEWVLSCNSSNSKKVREGGVRWKVGGGEGVHNMIVGIFRNSNSKKVKGGGRWGVEERV